VVKPVLQSLRALSTDEKNGSVIKNDQAFH